MNSKAVLERMQDRGNCQWQRRTLDLQLGGERARGGRPHCSAACGSHAHKVCSERPGAGQRAECAAHVAAHHPQRGAALSRQPARRAAPAACVCTPTPPALSLCCQRLAALPPCRPQPVAPDAISMCNSGIWCCSSVPAYAPKHVCIRQSARRAMHTQPRCSCAHLSLSGRCSNGSDHRPRRMCG